MCSSDTLYVRDFVGSGRNNSSTQAQFRGMCGQPHAEPWRCMSCALATSPGLHRQALSGHSHFSCCPFHLLSTPNFCTTTSLPTPKGGGALGLKEDSAHKSAQTSFLVPATSV